MIKSVFDRLIGRLGVGPGRSPLSSDSIDGSELEHELLVVAKASELNSSFQDGFTTPSPPCTPVERMETPEQDEVLFSKNNVFLSYPKRASLKSHDLMRFSSLEASQTTPSSSQALPSTNDNFNSNSSASGSFQDNQILVPGYLFITTRGSNYGTTLILNWAPNSSMRVPPVSSSLPLHLRPSASTNSLGSTSAAISTLTNGDTIISCTDDRERDLGRTNGSRSITEYTEGDAIVVMATNSTAGENPSNSWPIAMAIGGRGGDTLVAAGAGGRVEKVGAGVGLSRVGVSGEDALLGYDRPSCSSVSIDLGMMEMIRIFYNTDKNGFIVSGEMVIRSKDRNFKVFRFKTGGLNELVHILRSWKYFKHNWHKESQQHTFTVFQPKLSLAELHPLEGTIASMLTADMWRDLRDGEGRIIDKQYVLKVIFFQGVAPPLRKEVWPFLLGLYSFDSSERERTRVKSKKLEEYWTINKRRRTLEKEAATVVKTNGEPTPRQANSSSNSSTGSSSSNSTTVAPPAPPTENGSFRRSMMKYLSTSEASSSTSSATTSGTVEMRTHPQQQQQRVRRAAEGTAHNTAAASSRSQQPTPPSPPLSVDIKALINQVGKDVRRTDKNHPYYKGENNINTKTLMNILLNYLIHKPEISYRQGMTDLLAPLLAALDDEAEAFWCFTKLVQSSIFYMPGKSHISVKHQLEPLSLLIQLLIPSFYAYLDSTEEGLTLMFCHRWLLVCLKREFPEEDALAIWEACWTNYETTSFHLFICVAIMAMYGQRAIERNMNINELMVFFNTLSQSMPRDTVMSQARGYLHRFCRSAQVHCKLYPIMTREFWERKGSPRLVCEECKGLVNCPRTGFVPKKGPVC